MTSAALTPSFLDMDRIAHFIRPIIEGGVGGGTSTWIAYCLGIRPERVHAALAALQDQGRAYKTEAAEWRLTRPQGEAP